MIVKTKLTAKRKRELLIILQRHMTEAGIYYDAIETAHCAHVAGAPVEAKTETLSLHPLISSFQEEVINKYMQAVQGQALLLANHDILPVVNRAMIEDYIVDWLMGSFNREKLNYNAPDSEMDPGSFTTKIIIRYLDLIFRNEDKEDRAFEVSRLQDLIRANT